LGRRRKRKSRTGGFVKNIISIAMKQVDGLQI
jgi:glycerol-3-phosphate dehydrogenase